MVRNESRSGNKLLLQGPRSLLKKGEGWLRRKSKIPLNFKHSKVPVSRFQQAARGIILRLKSEFA